ncbi:MAG TPA: class I SAM-dependent methyltransferase [Solirubrobacteraceae bacterium]
MTNVPAIFDAHASEYEALRRRLIPPYDAFYGAAVAALALANTPLRRILDVGAGTGLLARAVAAAYPQAALTLFDGAPAMLARARAVLGTGASYVTGDFGALPPGPWDAVVSALAIHHVDDGAKRDLFARVHDALAPGGVFVNAEQVRGASALFDDANARWHERRAAELGTTAQEWAAACERMLLDHLATVDQQLSWLRDAGFAEVDCVFKDHKFAVLVARRSG